MKTSTEQDYQDRILRVLIHIQNHLNKAVSLDELAAVANFSPYHFHRVFRGMTGETVMDHIRRLRLERAAYLLKYNGDSVTHIAFDAGYETLDAFTKTFRDQFGVPPSVYRKEKRVMSYPKSPANVSYHPQGELADFEPINTGALDMDAQIKALDPVRVAFVRAQGPYAKSAETAWQKLCGWAGRKGLFSPNTRFIGVSYDDPDITQPDKIRYDACLTLTKDLPPEGEVGMQEIGGGLFAVTVVRGPYEKSLAPAYARLCGEWVPKQGYRLRIGPSLEVYLNDPDQVKPEDLLTEIYVPVEKG